MHFWHFCNYAGSAKTIKVRSFTVPVVVACQMHACMENLKQYSRQLERTIDEVEESSLFIEESHYKELKELLKEFSEYRIGKTRLVHLYHAGFPISSSQIQKLIRHNRTRKERYEELVDKVKKDLRKQIGGTSRQ